MGWVVTSKTPVKVGHLAANPYVACSYWSPDQNIVYADCVASWVEDEESKRYVWDLFMTTPPLGYDLSWFRPQRPAHPLFSPLRLDPWRVQVLRFEGGEGNLVPRTWRADG